MSRLRPLLASIVPGAAVLALILIADALRQPATPDIAFWPAAGVALGALVIAPPRRWPVVVAAIALGAFIAAFVLRPEDELPRLVLRGLSETVGPLVAAVLLRLTGRWRERTSSPLAGVLAFLLVVVGGAAIGAVAMTATAVETLELSTAQRFVDTWAAVAIGMLVVTPAILAAADDHGDDVAWRSLVLALAAVGLTLIVFLVPARELPPAVSYPFVVLPLLVAAAVRGAPRLAALTAIGVVTVAWLATASGLGPVFRDELDPEDRVRALQALVVTVALSSLLVVAEASARRRSSRDLATSEERYRTLVQGMPDAMALLWGTDYRCLTADGPMLAREGLEREDLVGRRLDEVLPPEQVATVRPLLDAAFADRIEKAEIASGTRGRLYEAETVPVHLPGGRLEGAYLVLRDVSERRRQEQGVRRAEFDLETIFREAAVGEARVDTDGRLHGCDPTFCELLGRPAEQLDGTPAAGAVVPDDADDLRDALVAVRDGRIRRAELELSVRGPEDALVRCVAHVVPAAELRHSGEQTLRLVDVSDERRAAEQLASLAQRDPLTGLPGRAAFCGILDARIADDDRPEGTLLVADVDDFRETNAMLGRHLGDDVLVSLAEQLRELHPGRPLGRVSGDAFALLLEERQPEEAERVAEALVTAVRDDRQLEDTRAARHPITVSCGVVLLGGRPTTGETLVAEGELAVQDAKAAGRDRHALHARPTTVGVRGRRRLAWIERLEGALEDGGFVLEAQPIERLSDAVVTQHELLLRLRDEDGGLVPPAQFLPVAERFGLIGRIDRWVATEAIDLLGRIPEDVSLEVNVSGRSIGDPQLLQAIEEGLARTGVSPARLVLEITETAAVGDVARAQAFSDQLADLGCGFALDDFGVGFGSFYYLKHLRWDYLKIDGEFVRGCLNDRSDRLVIDALVRLAQGLGRRTIAEYVGDPATRAHLREVGVDLAQGYHVGRPVPLHRAFPDAVAAPTGVTTDELPPVAPG